MTAISNDPVNMSFRVDRKTKQAADELFRSMGMNTSTALNIFLRQSIVDGGMPFRPHFIEKPSPQLRAAIRELDDYESGRIRPKTYNTIDDLWKDLNSDDV